MEATTMFRTLTLVCTLAALGGIAIALAADEPAKKPSVWMRTKLENSQKVLSGLATEDFDAIAQNAKSMNNLSELEKHVRSNAPGYRTQLQIFRAANDDLIKQANKKNLDGCALAFNQLTLSCVNCHKALRDKY
jgi:cytochrome c556